MAYNSTYGIMKKAFQGYYGDATTPGNPATGISQWGYVTADAAATVEAAGYFNSMYSSLAKGDAIDCVMAIAGTPVLKSYVVTASASTGVTIALQTATAG
jgi:hypothetical protein